MQTKHSEFSESDCVPASNVTQVSTKQRKLSVGDVDDPLEHEADTVADKVMSMQTIPPATKANGDSVQRKCADCQKDEEEKNIQRKPLASFIQRKESGGGITASDNVSSQINSGKGNGNRMDASTRSFMEGRFGADFSSVKIHTGNESIQMSRELNAKAFTVGNDIYFNDGEYQPQSNNGKHLLAHELTHTIQQSGSSKGIQRTVSPSRVSCNSYPRSYPIFSWMGTIDPVGEIQAADARAIELLTNAIDGLNFVMLNIQGGAFPAVPTFSDCMAESIHTRLRIDPENAASWTGSGPGSLRHFVRWLTNLRRTFQSGWVRYNCRGPLCQPNYGAYIVSGQGFLVNLCQNFWSTADVDIRALQLIHEFAHVYYDTEDSGRGAGNSYCIHGIVADLNNLHATMAGFEDCGGAAMQSC